MVAQREEVLRWKRSLKDFSGLGRMSSALHEKDSG